MLFLILKDEFSNYNCFSSFFLENIFLRIHLYIIFTKKIDKTRK